MAIRIICICGRSMEFEDESAGCKVKCPNCHASLRIPSSDEDKGLLRWNCSCGQRLKARSRSAGRSIRCPRCSAINTVPVAMVRPASSSSASSEDSISTESSVPAPEEDSAIELPPAGANDSPDDGAFIPLMEDDPPRN